MVRHSPLAAVRAASGETKLVVGLVSASHFLNHMYLVLLPPIFGVLAPEFGVDLAALGLAVGIQALVNTVFQLPFGYVSDNYSRTVALGTGLLLAAVGVSVIATASTYTILLVGQAVLGLGIAAHHPAHYPLLSAATNKRNRGRVFSLHGFSGNMGYAASPVVLVSVLALPSATWRDAMLLVAVVGIGFAVVCTSLLALVVDADVTRASNESSTNSTQTDRSLAAIGTRLRSEVRSLLSSPGILALTLLALVTSMSAWGVRSYAVVLLTGGYGFSLTTANAALTAMFVASAVVVLVGGELTDRVSAGRVILTSFVLLALTTATVASFLVPAAVALGLTVLMGGAMSLGMPARSKLADALSKRSDLGMNFALITVGVTTAGAAAPPFFGTIIDARGFGVAFYIISALAVLGAGLSVAILQRLDG